MSDPYADIRETHSGVVVLLGDRAYKLKKPVRLGFLDFSTPDLRRRACEQEVLLNRRLAPDVYLGTGTLRDPARADEPVVVMRRMPEDRRLAALVGAGADVTEEVRRLARLLVTFHAAARRGADVDAEGTRDAIRSRWEASFEQVAPHLGVLLDPGAVARVRLLVREYLEGRERLFEDRVAAGAVVDGHGDLMAEDIFCLDDGPRVLDCLEFDDRLRYVDRIDDVSFLAMDLERLGDLPAGELLIRTYLELGGDHVPPSLTHHFVAYRAFVRAKVSCLQGAQTEGPVAPAAAAYLRQTVEHLEVGRSRLVVVGGPPGSGKTTVAGGVADRLGMVLLSSDRLRKELAGCPPEESASAAYERGIYAPGWTRRTYQELLARARGLLARGESVVLDASWSAASFRREAAVAAGDASAQLVQLRCDLDPAVATRRLLNRRGGSSDADPGVAARMRGSSDPWPEATSVDTSDSPEACVASAVSAVRG